MQRQPLGSRSGPNPHPMNFKETEDDSEHNDIAPAVRAQAATRSTWVSVVVNLVLSVIQIAVGIWAKSQGLVADGLHSLSDLVADFVVLAGRPREP